jgi:hypothetical protein
MRERVRRLAAMWAKLLGAQTGVSSGGRRFGLSPSSTRNSPAGAFRPKPFVWCLRAEDQRLLRDHDLDVLE